MPSVLSMTCLLALKQHRDCLSLVTKEVKRGTTNADVYILRARLYNFFQKVEQRGRAGAVPPLSPGSHSMPRDYKSQPTSHIPTV